MGAARWPARDRGLGSTGQRLLQGPLCGWVFVLPGSTWESPFPSHFPPPFTGTAIVLRPYPRGTGLGGGIQAGMHRARGTAGVFGAALPPGLPRGLAVRGDSVSPCSARLPLGTLGGSSV